MFKNNKLTVGISVLFILIGVTLLLSRDMYDEPTGGMDVASGISEDGDQLIYWIETDFIPNAKYTVNINVHLPVGAGEASLVEPLKEITFRADEDMDRFEESIAITAIKEVILDIDDLNFDNLERTAENWRDYEYAVRMYRTKLWQPYDSVGFFNTLEVNE